MCSKCPYSSKNAGTLRKHFRFRHTAWKQSCEFCGKVVKQLDKHLKATMCGKDVDDRNRLPCPKCPVIVWNQSQLRKHTSQVHDRVKDKYCPKCSYTTYSSYNLRLHVSSVHDKTPIVYKNCPHCHVRSGNLNKHLEIHHIEEMQIET